MPQSNAPVVQQYFDAALKQLNDPPITCGFAGENKGKAIFASRAIKAGHPIWSEPPFVAMQHEDNKDFADCCEHCFVSLINSQDAWERVEAANDGANDVAKFEDFTAAIDFLQKQGGKSDDESYFNVYRLAKHKVQCTCGVLYCSNTCRTAAWAEQHALLCSRADDNSTPMGHFLNHTLVTNEIFQLAGKVIARVLMRFIATRDVALARQPVDMFCKAPWWDVVVSEDDLDDGQTLDGQRGVFKELIGQTLNHFLTGLHDNLESMAKNDELNGLSVDAVTGSCADVLTLDFFGSIVGMFEMNNISLEIDHPFHTLSEALVETVTEGKSDVPAVLVKVKNALEKYAEKYQHACDCGHDHGHGHNNAAGDNDIHDHSHEHNHDHGHEHSHEHGHGHGHEHGSDIDDSCAEYDDDFVGVEGTALFPVICTMNHDCDPNCTVIYMKDGTAQVYAVQDINVGDELCISYIDVDQTEAERGQCLHEYQFQCHCARCEEERNA